MNALTSPHLHDNLIAALHWAGHPQPDLFVPFLPPGSLPTHHTTSRGADRVYCALIATLTRHFPRLHPSDLSAHATGALSRLAQMLILPGERTALAAQLHALRDPQVYTTPGMMGHALLAALRTTVPSRALLTRTHRCECYQNLNIKPVVPGDPDAAVRAALESGVAVTGEAAARITSQGLTTGLTRLEAPPRLHRGRRSPVHLGRWAVPHPHRARGHHPPTLRSGPAPGASHAPPPRRAGARPPE